MRSGCWKKAIDLLKSLEWWTLTAAVFGGGKRHMAIGEPKPTRPSLFLDVHGS